ncbi:hypothetical protein SERLADRAFT_375803 [Serpula lacrymans var. lacrymans S7.9]|uniref:Uncharacterized protein n=1 Tax=Serpula lacrymans var. lacrymans (strain S7.9) TaxID=578457 RepID=F8NEF6_SERL9|nr:uncharacterized protein SERLADRAFT_375803 [Serpula lacrymans var. lacrymans S7.9]EGO30590.1 hypothetical protein SERLADRAFT_375803 [Serpula lacrymans var. lacrymans S7.9]
MKILGRVVDDSGIRMDPDKVTSVLNWKVPTNRDLWVSCPQSPAILYLSGGPLLSNELSKP